jgi:hypothetical protein
MKPFFNFAVAAVLYLFINNSSVAQNAKILSNKEILMEVSINPENKAVIKWISQEDHQTSRFIVQRSRDNETFFDIREIEVKQEATESRQRLQFAFKDSKMLRNVEYYRVVEYENDGQSHIYTSLSVKPISPVSIVKTGDLSCVLRVIVEDSKNLTALVSTESGLGVPCEFEISENNDVILKPAYSLNGGNYLVKLRSSTGEKQFKFTVKSDDVL